MKRQHHMPFGAELSGEGVRFSVWAPTAQRVSLLLEGAEHPMPESDGGWRASVVPAARPGQRYAFRIDDRLIVPDPASRFQPEDAHGPSMIIDPRAYAWSDAGWTGRPWEEAVLYELHVGTATTAGTFAELQSKLPEIAELGVTAIELMPLADFPGSRNWGYDGVLPFAPDAAYGTPDELKRLIDSAHALRLMVFIDVVYNHFGPSGNHLPGYAAPFFTDRHLTPWGSAVNFDGAESRPVRDFFIHNALYWLEEFHADGLRLDAVHAVHDESGTHILAEIASSVRQAISGREVHLVLENDANESRWLARDRRGHPQFYTAQWNDDWHHAWHVLLTGEREGYYEDYSKDAVGHLGRAASAGFAYQGEPSPHRGGRSRGQPSAHLPPSAFVAFLQNHDQTGNRAFGERLCHMTGPERLALARAALLLSPQIPLLFMGEAWAASSPFQFFVDFGEDESLAMAVREGRRREFARFGAFADPQSSEPIPDPTAPATAARSVLDWGERRREPHGRTLAETSRLLHLRASRIVPLVSSAYLGASFERPWVGALDVTWRLAAGELNFFATGGAAARSLEIGLDCEILWKSAAVRESKGTVRLPEWTGLALESRAP